MKLSKEETLKKLQELQLKYLGEVDMNVRYEIETRKDQKCTMVISYCNYTENFERKVNCLFISFIGIKIIHLSSNKWN